MPKLVVSNQRNVPISHFHRLCTKMSLQVNVGAQTRNEQGLKDKEPEAHAR